jgi:hypothetical protein
MKFRNQFMKYKIHSMAEDGSDAGGGSDGGDDTGGGDGGTDSGGTDVAAIQAQLETIKAENDRLSAKIQAANKHQKEAERVARQKDREKAEADGNYEELFKSSESERETLAQQIAQLQSSNEKREIDTASLKMASEISEGANVHLLSRFISERLKYTENGVKVTDTNGSLTVSTLDDLKREFAGSAQFASLIKGNQSSGGGASGGSSGGGAAVEYTRADFDALDPAQQAETARKPGFKIVS